MNAAQVQPAALACCVVLRCRACQGWRVRAADEFSLRHARALFMTHTAAVDCRVLEWLPGRADTRICASG